jgi:signal transduction histidine kinase
MSLTTVSPCEALPEAGASLETVLGAWHAATLRLEQTHQVLREEVCRLTDELEAKNRELARKDRLADLGRMASHVAHEVRNNLVPVTLYLSLLRRRISHDPASVTVLDKIELGFTALDATVHDLLQFTSDRDPQLQTFLLHGLTEELFTSLAPQLAAQSIQAVNDVSPAAQITADRHMLRRALLNLMLNAVDAMPQGGSMRIHSAADRGGIQVEVADSGTGLSDDTLRRAFEPFFSTKSGGTGLGLAIVYRVAEAHGGRVAAGNRPEGGAAFTLHLPQPVQEAVS